MNPRGVAWLTWTYDWLYSCPSIVVLGRFKVGKYEGVSILNLLYPRVVVLGRGSSITVYSNIPSYFYGEVVRDICINLSRGVFPSRDFIENAITKAMYYGGLSLFVKKGGEAVPLLFELIDTSRYSFYFKPAATPSSLHESPVEYWLLLGLGLRTGIVEYIVEPCLKLGGYSDGVCRINVGVGELVIASKKGFEEPGYMRVVPDNNPLRHVVKVK